MVDGEEDPEVVCARRHPAQHLELGGVRRREPGLPEARDPDTAEAGVLELPEGGAFLPDAVVYGSNQKRGAIITAASGEEGSCNEPRSANGALTRTSGLPGRVGCTIETDRRYQPGAKFPPSVT